MSTNTVEKRSLAEQRIFAVILSSGFLSTLGVGLFSFTMPLVSLDEKVSGAWLGSAFAGYYFAKLLIAPLSGLWADRAGPRTPLLAASLMGAAAPLLYLLHPGMPILYFIQFVMGLVSGLIKPVGLAVLGGSGRQSELSRWFSLHALVFNVALFCGPMVGGILYLNRDMTPIMTGLSLCMALTTVILGIGLPNHIRTRKQRSAMSASARQPSPFDMTALCMALAGRTLGIGMVVTFYPILLSTMLGRHGMVIGATFATPNLVACLGLFLSGHIFRGRPRPMTVVAGMLLSAAGVFALGACRELWQFALAGTIMGLGSAISIPSSMALASSLARSQGKIFGTAHFAAGIGFLVGPLLGGLIIRNYHSIGPAMQVAAILGACLCLPLMVPAFEDQLKWGRRLAWGGALFCTIAMAGFGSLPLVLQKQVIPKSAPGLYYYTDVAMGTVVRLTLVARNETEADAAFDKVLTSMRSIQRDLDFRSASGSIGRINRNAGRNWVTPTPRAYGLLQRTLNLSRLSNGIFDPTVGALTTSPLYYALDETIAQAKKDLVDYRMIIVDETTKRVRLKKRGMALDMGGIAKGTIIDEAVAILRKQGIKAGIVEAGGDFYCFGNRDWTVGVRHPRAQKIYTTVTVREKGVCGSGDYQQFVAIQDEQETILRHHIINPSDMDSAHESVGVTVIANSAEKADALATTLFILGPNRGRAFMREHFPKDAALWFRPDLSVAVTDNFPR
ncbi:MFS transporter [Pseudodesulfovibrio tunisiensis]|uniref:MFS transporter n=1 Tax=Pseudodesulfovibrio tunisiensis TaxID=463192 RepID=UPI001FB43003|nr:MFS transporter [Pseudodesulfovibrio tunisiensis]